jgi:hypothetical protein
MPVNIVIGVIGKENLQIKFINGKKGFNWGNRKSIIENFL